jgi:hypothetical protein
MRRLAEQRKRTSWVKPVAMRDPLTRTLLILTFVTGIVDVVSFLALGNVFGACQQRGGRPADQEGDEGD